MADSSVTGQGTEQDPWVLKTPPGKSEYQMYRDDETDPPALVCVVGKTKLSYQARCLEDLQSILEEHEDWMLLGSSDEKKEPKEGTVEALACSTNNPVGGWYGLRKGFRGRFANYDPPLMEHLGLAEVEHKGRSDSLRAP